ncbi:twin-arginine translocation signal domain-containing protein [Pseudonocardiaceae bacterium YIM PH 21723]|nr:twin-arginine translocation signal domain-containing protein [Pseudonocardiaceae bacterium YIM PH 21723]
MFGKKYAAQMINRSAENDTDRRRFLKAAGLAGLGVVGATALGTLGGSPVSIRPSAAEGEGEVSDAAVLNFALNLEYLEAQFYSFAVYGAGLPDNLLDGSGDQGGVVGGHQVTFKSRTIRQYATEIASDERQHVEFLRKVLGDAKVAQPKIDLQNSFSAAAQAAGLVKAGEAFDAFANEENFLLAAYLFEDVGVTAYKGAAPLIQNKTYLEAAAGILAAEAYHAANIRSAMFEYDRDLTDASVKISDARDSLDGKKDLDQGIIDDKGNANIAPLDGDGIAFSRSPGQVLNIVYLNPKKVESGGFFPNGVNGDVKESDDN